MKIRNAFTLVELLVTVSVLSLLAAFIVPTYQLVLSQFELTSAANEAADFIRLTEQKTVTEQKVYGITLTSGSGTIPQFLYDSGTGSKTTQTTHTLPSWIVISEVNFSGNSDIRFAPSGAPNVSGSIVIKDTVRNRSRKIEIRPSGAVSSNQGEY